MASAKQIAWRKKFARMAKAGKFRKSKKKSTQLTGGIRSSRKGKQKGDRARRELDDLNRDIPQFEMVHLSETSQKLLDKLKKRQKILRVQLHSSQYDKYYHD